MRVAITGASGLLGSAVRHSLEGDGHTVVPLVRDRSLAGDGCVYWDPASGEIDAAGLIGVDAVAHFAGEPFGARRWNAEHKQRLRDSRVQGTRLLAEALASLSGGPGSLVSTSATGYYGDRGDDELTEDAAPGQGFMADFCVDWEAATAPASAAGLRVAISRTGVVVARDSDLLRKMLPPFKLGVGGRVGHGRQWVPWLAHEDHVRAIRLLLERDDLAGPFNVVSPAPVRNRDLATALGKVLRRPAVLPIPPLVLRVVYGEVATMLGLDSQRVVPRRLLHAGFEFRHADIEEAIRAALHRP